MGSNRYCLDTSALIQPWNTYYSMELCPEYWDVLDDLARRGVVFCTQDVKREIKKGDDELFAWVKQRPFLFQEVTAGVQQNLRSILQEHRDLVDTKRDRSMADAWVIAHAMAEGATVVTKEGFAPRRVKIPDVCNALGVRCVDDFIFLREVGVRFSARL